MGSKPREGGTIKGLSFRSGSILRITAFVPPASEVYALPEPSFVRDPAVTEPANIAGTGVRTAAPQQPAE